MCLPSWLYRSLHSARFMGHCFLSVGALLSFQNHLLESETYWIQKKKILVCATKFRTNILCKNSKTAGKALAAAWNPSKCWHLGNLRLTFRFDFFAFFAFFAFYTWFLFFDSFANCNRQTLIYQFVRNRIMLPDYISIQQWQKCVVPNSFVGVDLDLPLVDLLFCC